MGVNEGAARRRLARLCARFGRDVRLTQAAGSNLSVKLGGKRLLVKQSGFRLRDVRAGAGLSLVDYEKLAAGVRRERWSSLGYAARQARHAALIARAAADPACPPSMETSLHALLPQRFVAHLHSLASILLGALPKRDALALLRAAVGPGVALHRVPAVLPGLDLALALDALARGESADTPAFWLLENHGAICAASSAEELERLVAAVEKKLRASLGLAAFDLPHVEGGGFCFCKWPSFRFSKTSFTPDYAVYSALAIGAARVSGRVVAFGAGRDARELVFAQAVLGTVGKKLKPLPRGVARRVTGMEAERARMRCK